MTRISILLFATIAASTAFAQAPAPGAPVTARPAPQAATPRAPAPAASSAYCVAAAAGFMQSDSAGHAALSQCARGDTIILPGQSTNAIARVCDFTRSIVAAGGTVICSIVLPARFQSAR
jgi:hypothetical protein